MKTEDIDKLVDNIADTIKLGIRHTVESARDAGTQAESAWEKVNTTATGAGTSAQKVNFHLGEWRRFCEGGEAYQVVSPLRKEGDEWIMRIQLKDGTNAEYPLSQVETNPPLVGE
jgi:cytochrome oxidase assembly protein ShyY1